MVAHTLPQINLAVAFDDPTFPMFMHTLLVDAGTVALVDTLLHELTIEVCSI